MEIVGSPNIMKLNPITDWFKKKKPRSKVVATPPLVRSSSVNIKENLYGLKQDLGFVKPDFLYEFIPVIRKLLVVNSSVSLATSSLVQLINTGHRIKFDDSIDPEIQKEMREHLSIVTKFWGQGLPGLHGLINRLIYQVFIGGAMAAEWVLKKDLSGIGYLAFLNPEDIRVAFNYNTLRYEYYQVNKNFLQQPSALQVDNFIKLNPITFQYYGLIGDQDSPVGIPPFLSALDDIQSQLKMLRNIGYVSDQLGIMGFLELLMMKPEPNEGESDAAYQSRLESLLDKAKNNVKDGVKDGMVAGYIDDHEFEFHSTTKDTRGVGEIFDINQRMVSNGLLTSPQFLGGAIGGTETLMTVVFTKMLSQLADVQNYVKAIIERGLSYELLMAGYGETRVTLEFKTSTITDEVKFQQGREIKQRILRQLYADGIISQAQYSWEMGYTESDEDEPRVEIDPSKVAAEQKSKEGDQDNENATARRTRDKEKTQPKRKDNSTKRV